MNQIAPKKEESVIVSQDTISRLVSKWRNYLLINPYKLFIEDNQYHSYQDCITEVEKHNGFQITAFAGKAQNRFTHPSRLPGMGELNLLTKIRCIQLITHNPVRIIFDGEYYADIFEEDRGLIRAYEQEIINLGKIVNLNAEFSEMQTFFTVDQLFTHFKVDQEQVNSLHKAFKDNPKPVFDELDLYPGDFVRSMRQILPDDKNRITSAELYQKAEKFIIKKALLARAMDGFSKEDDFQRLTILQYSKASYPRLNMEMSYAPWNSTLLFKNTYLNINTATSGAYSDLSQDIRNYPIVGDSGYFWAFTRNKSIFKDIS